MREGDLIRWIRKRTHLDRRRFPVGPGDDCAVIAGGGAGWKKLLVTTDQVLDGVHFILSRDGPAAAGRKAMARNLSDIAAMAGVPIAAVAAVALPKGIADHSCRRMCIAMQALGRRFGCPVVGGDVSAWAGPLAITVTVFGRPAAKQPVLRGGAREGDAVCVTGRLGGAWRTRRHLEFIPRLAEAAAMARRYDLHAMIDVSDGLGRDLGHICEESGVGAQLCAESIPVHPSAGGLNAALNDGEDYELLFTLPAGQAAALVARPPVRVKITRIGTITAGRKIVLLDAGGGRSELRLLGWQHET